MPNLEQWAHGLFNEIEQMPRPNLTISSSCPYLLEAIPLLNVEWRKTNSPPFYYCSGSLNNANPLNCRLIGCAIEMIHRFSLDS